MKRLEKALRAELAAWGGGLTASTLTEAALGLARRLDAAPSDREAVALTRELRLVLADLRGLSGVQSELEGFLAGIAAPSLR